MQCEEHGLRIVQEASDAPISDGRVEGRVAEALQSVAGTIPHVGGDWKGSRPKWLFPWVPCDQDVPVGESSGTSIPGNFRDGRPYAHRVVLVVTLPVLGWCSCLVSDEFGLEPIETHFVLLDKAWGFSPVCLVHDSETGTASANRLMRRKFPQLEASRGDIEGISFDVVVGGFGSACVQHVLCQYGRNILRQVGGVMCVDAGFTAVHGHAELDGGNLKGREGISRKVACHRWSTCRATWKRT